ncbi:hypothetical protein TGARI_369540 [Toxoplasma gondii ARI]|uniref:Uncharacterized protein n=1 Tax=Toxoplasma gondii ARI TaxID=1074872 RepID=A0A139Y0X1_TOXGO|nr:hypothetical protein TGARI_369540 [Toxoplasma gondii ARI]
MECCRALDVKRSPRGPSASYLLIILVTPPIPMEHLLLTAPLGGETIFLLGSSFHREFLLEGEPSEIILAVHVPAFITESDQLWHSSLSPSRPIFTRVPGNRLPEQSYFPIGEHDASVRGSSDDISERLVFEGLEKCRFLSGYTIFHTSREKRNVDCPIALFGRILVTDVVFLSEAGNRPFGGCPR